MALFRAAQPKSCGIAVLNNKEIIVDFVEKPETPFSDLANGGVYAASPEIIKLIPNKPVADIGFDLLPLLKNKMAGFEIKNFHLDIGTFENLKKAEAEWPVASIKNQN